MVFGRGLAWLELRVGKKKDDLGTLKIAFEWARGHRLMQVVGVPFLVAGVVSSDVISVDALDGSLVLLVVVPKGFEIVCQSPPIRYST